MKRREFISALSVLGGAALTGCAGTSTGIRESNARVIDVHTHWYPPEYVSLLEKEGGANGAKMGRDKNGNSVVLSVPGSNQPSNLRRNMIDLDVILQEMDKRGIDVNVLSLTNPMVSWAPPAFGLRLSQAWNDACAAAHLKHPQRFVGTVMLPMQEPKLAVQELQRAAKLPGMHGVFMAESFNGKNLHDKSYWPVYEQCEALGLPILLHALYALGTERLLEFRMLNLLGSPFEGGVAGTVLMFGGVLDAFPKLDFMLPHAGDTFPWLIGRADQGYRIGVPELQGIKQRPLEYLRRFYYDSISLNTQVMTYLIGMVGADRIMLGSDYDQISSEKTPVQFVSSLPGLSIRERNMILGGNAERFLKLPPRANT